MTSIKLPSFQFKKMITKLEVYNRPSVLNNLTNWVNQQQNDPQASQLSGWLGRLANIAHLPSKEFGEHPHWRDANMYDKCISLKTIVKAGLAVK